MSNFSIYKFTDLVVLSTSLNVLYVLMTFQCRESLTTDSTFSLHKQAIEMALILIDLLYMVFELRGLRDDLALNDKCSTNCTHFYDQFFFLFFFGIEYNIYMNISSINEKLYTLLILYTT